MGWLGWEPSLALSTDAAIVEAALASRTDLIKMVFGDGKPVDKTKQAGKVTPDKFRAFKDRVNQNRRQSDDGK